MVRNITRSYQFSERDVREALVAWLKSKDMNAPQYVGTTDTCKWTRCADGGQSVEWTDQDEIQ